MTDERLREAFAHMGPSDEAKRRMLANILAAGGQRSDDGAGAGSGRADTLDGGISHFSRIASSSAGPSRSGMDALDGGTSHPIVGAPSLDDAARTAAAPQPQRRFRAWRAAGIGAAACLVLLAGAGILSLSQSGAPDASSLKGALSASSAASEETVPFDASALDTSANSVERAASLPFSFEFRERTYTAVFEAIEADDVGELIGEVEVSAASDGASEVLSVYALSDADPESIDAVAVTSSGSAEFYRYESAREPAASARS